jgi:hypothetical protein
MTANFEAILNEAITAAVVASAAFHEKYGDRGACGFAWVEIVDGRSPFVNWCKKQIKSIASKGETEREVRSFEQQAERLYGSKHSKYWTFWNPSKNYSQTVDTLEAGADAFAAVLKSHGIECYSMSRLD